MKNLLTAITIITMALLTGCNTTPVQDNKQERFEKVQRDAEKATRDLEHDLDREFN